MPRLILLIFMGYDPVKLVLWSFLTSHRNGQKAGIFQGSRRVGCVGSFFFEPVYIWPKRKLGPHHQHALSWVPSKKDVPKRGLRDMAGGADAPAAGLGRKSAGSRMSAESLRASLKARGKPSEFARGGI